MVNKINATIVADSKCPRGHRITTFLLTYPRIIHSEILTHRMFSRNAASSRAIPTAKLIQSIKDEPFIPIAWQTEHKGMQGANYITSLDNIQECESDWLKARDNAIESAELLMKGFPEYKSSIEGEDIPYYDKVTKQIANRLLEPFQYYTSLVTATEFDNFFELRCPQYFIDENPTSFKKSRKELLNDCGYNIRQVLHNYSDIEWLQHNKGMAEIHLMDLAEKMYDAYNESIPKELQEGSWHIPFGNKIDVDVLLDNIDKEFKNYPLFEEADKLTKEVIKISVSMAARTSYTVVGDEKEFTYQQHIALHDRMANQVPFHASPFEHIAKVPTLFEYESNIKGNITWTRDISGTIDDVDVEQENVGWFDNYHGFKSYRKILEESKHA